MRYKARFPEVFFCRRDYLECLFLLSCLLPPPSGFCHRWPAWTPAVRSGRSPGLGKQRAPGFPRTLRGGGWQSGRPAGGFAGETECQGGAQPWTLPPFPSAQPLTWAKPQHSEMESWIANFEAFISDLAYLPASLSIAYSFSNFYDLSLFPNNLRKTCCELVTCQCFSLGFIWLSHALM